MAVESLELYLLSCTHPGIYNVKSYSGSTGTLDVRRGQLTSSFIFLARN